MLKEYSQATTSTSRISRDDVDEEQTRSRDGFLL